jgi:hypothetical protein
MTEFKEFPKIPRLSRECFITEKIDGTNAQITITDDGRVIAGSRSRFITINDDNYGFAKWVDENKDELLKLGVGTHYGEWWGCGIQRGYGLKEKRFSLFNVSRWTDDKRPSCCSVVPIIYNGLFTTESVDSALALLKEKGSIASPGFNRPEGVVVYHTSANCFFKKTLNGDTEKKGG